MWLALAFALAASLIARTSPAQEAPIPPAPARWVTDSIGLLKPDSVRELDAELQAYQRQTGHQVVVWVGSSTGATPLDDFAVRTFENWKIGRKGLDDGVLILVFAQDRKLAIEVGYGLEDRLPDATASRIINEVMVPLLRANDPDGAVREGAAAVLSAIEGKPFQAAPGAKHPSAEPRAPPSALRIVLFVIAGIVFLILLITNPALALNLLLVVGGRGFGGGGGGGGGGFSGGGGRSGGGGARGSW